MNTLQELYDVIQSRREQPQEGSYTCYLFQQGLDKILKKVGEESAELIIAAKGGDREATALEACDLIYHMLVLLVQAGIPLSEIEEELHRRGMKIGNLKQQHATDRQS